MSAPDNSLFSEKIIDESRVLSFSDAVFAFAATLLVLKIDLPELDPAFVSAQLPNALLQLWPTYFANIMSFLLIGYYWLNHHALFASLKRFNKTIVWLNLIFLIFLSFLPFPVDLFGDYSNESSVIIFYAISISLVGYMLAFMWWYAAGPGKLVDPAMARKRVWYHQLRYLVAPLVFTLSIPIAVVDPSLARFSWFAMLVGVVIASKVLVSKK